MAIASGQLAEGQRLCSVREMAQVLKVHPNTVAKAYSFLAREGVIESHRGRGTFVTSRIHDTSLEAAREARLNSIMARAQVEALSLGFSLEQIEASFTLRLARFREEAASKLHSKREHVELGPGVVVMGSHDLALDLLGAHLKRQSGYDMTSAHTGSLAGLIALARGEAHIAGCHLLDEESGEYNIPFVRRILTGMAVEVVTLAGRSQGLLVPAGNPKGIQALKDLLRQGVTFINRQKGSGTRVLLDFLCRQVGLSTDDIHGYDIEVDTHTAVAAAVASGQADVGLGILAAARAFDLDFVPLQDERYDLVVPAVSRSLPQIAALFEALGSREFKASVSEMGGYDISQTGQVAMVSGR
jgi:putative molybdopterin biosynthesis protein